jgi:urease gamma subunit
VTEVRLFVADAPSGDWSELTDGDQRTVRVAAPDLQQARRVRARIRARGEDVAVILDVTVAVAGDFRSARTVLGSADHTVHYAGTVDGLAGLISDIASADVADGVTLIAASPRQDLDGLARDVLDRLTSRGRAQAS